MDNVDLQIKEMKKDIRRIESVLEDVNGGIVNKDNAISALISAKEHLEEDKLICLSNIDTLLGLDP